MRAILAGICLTLVLAGCGLAGVASPTATAVPIGYATFNDPQFGFSFKYPQNWSIPKSGGHTIQNSGLDQYVLDITLPGSEAGMSVELDGAVRPLPLTFVNGKRSHITGDPHTYVYFHRTVTQWPAMRVERFSGTKMNEIDTIFNTRKESYDIRTIAANPPFTSRALAGYDTIVRTFKPPFS